MTMISWWYELGQTAMMLLIAAAMFLHLRDPDAHWKPPAECEDEGDEPRT